MTNADRQVFDASEIVGDSPMTGEDMRKLRERIGQRAGREFTQADLARYLQSNQPSISRYENSNDPLPHRLSLALKLLSQRVKALTREQLKRMWKDPDQLGE